MNEKEIPAFLPNNRVPNTGDPRIAFSEKVEASVSTDPKRYDYFSEAQEAELKACRKDAASYVLDLLDEKIRAARQECESYERDKNLFKAEQARIFLDALKTARQGAWKALGGA